MAGRQSATIRRQFRARSVAQRHGDATRAHRRRVASRLDRGREALTARHLMPNGPCSPTLEIVRNLI